ncbi:hypothetical protein LCL61_17525 [Amycolatopsis coloradensis]|uniref:Uncharacterized protein n=1 Tax=Amycolatopsis coloradensis TaxID=76021 RepID=A0ACD5BD58_9PSEU
MFTPSSAATIADRFDIPVDLAVRLVNDIEYALNDGHTTKDEVQSDLAAHYAHQLDTSVPLDQVIECWIAVAGKEC